VDAQQLACHTDYLGMNHRHISVVQDDWRITILFPLYVLPVSKALTSQDKVARCGYLPHRRIPWSASTATKGVLTYERAKPAQL